MSYENKTFWAGVKELKKSALPEREGKKQDYLIATMQDWQNAMVTKA